LKRRLRRQQVICGSKAIPLGSAEIQVPDNRRRWFIAPNLLLHYVERHNYAPPAEFVQAVVDFPQYHSARCSKLAGVLQLPVAELTQLVVCPAGGFESGCLSDWAIHDSYVPILEIGNGLSLVDPYDGLRLWGREEFVEGASCGAQEEISRNLGVQPIAGDWPLCAGIRMSDGLVVFVDYEGGIVKSADLGKNLAGYVRQVIRLAATGDLCGVNGWWTLP
jgi:hypothetical protein